MDGNDGSGQMPRGGGLEEAAMRRGSRHDGRWTGWFEFRGGTRQGAERRSAWDLRCQEATCAHVHGRKSERWAPRRRRTRGRVGRFRAGGRLF
ncbi:MAG TPA: hypothetical protein VHU13_07120 [Solirubrobacteraceae bacterium]|nr:hypothetical protein [Solirubrobacteraceae bacterium]